MNDPHAHDPVVVIAPPEIAVEVRAAHRAVLRFRDPAEFERWRRRSARTIAPAVEAALAELNVELSRCSARTQEVLVAMSRRETVPSVKEMLAACSSRRSFYRSWSDDIGEAPSAFLERVRLLHLR